MVESTNTLTLSATPCDKQYKSSWDDNQNYTYIISDKNPNTDKIFDFWLIKTEPNKGSLFFEYMWAFRYGPRITDFDAETLGIPINTVRTYQNATQDHEWARHRAELLAWWFLAYRYWKLLYPYPG